MKWLLVRETWNVVHGISAPLRQAPYSLTVRSNRLHKTWHWISRNYIKGGILCYFWLDHVEVIAACFCLRRLGFKGGSVSCFKALAEIEGCVRICRRTMRRLNFELWINVKFSFKLGKIVNEICGTGVKHRSVSDEMNASKKFQKTWKV